MRIKPDISWKPINSFLPSKIYFTNSGQKWTFFGNGNQPVDDWGCRTELVEDDGSTDFDNLYARANDAPVITDE